MNQLAATNRELLAEFERWLEQNQNGGLPCIWRRRSVWIAQVIQKLRWHHEVSVPLFWGQNMQVITGETVSRSLLAFGYTEVALSALMLLLIEQGQTIVDIGTHFGYEALLGCKLVGEQGYVVCFEPHPISFSLAKKNLVYFPQVDLRQEAVADFCGTLKFQNRITSELAFNSASINEDAAECIDVAVTTLDISLANRSQPVDFIKCDVEGLELAVLKGADRVLSEDLPILVLEADMPSENGQVSARAHELARYLEKYGYQAFNFAFDEVFRFAPLGSFPVFHANIAFLSPSRPELLERLVGLSDL